jgi:hypothetical protein
MNFDHAISTLISRRFTERQARFLVLVARHSGVCVMRQYSAFAGVVFGHTTRKFFTKLERLGWVSTYDCARKRARIYHVRHRELYEAIGDAESRLRRPPTVPRALERIMLLDVILTEPDLVWLATSEEKMTHVSAFTAITKDSLPQMTTPQPAPRYAPQDLDAMTRVAEHALVPANPMKRPHRVTARDGRTRERVMASVPEALRQQVDRWAATWLTATFSRLLELRAREPGPYNYPIAVFSEWRGKAFYLNVRYRARTRRIEHDFVVRHTRMTLTGFGRFDLAYFRHTGCWFTVYRGLTATDCFTEIEGNEMFWPTT